jgi:hypothetical protein
MRLLLFLPEKEMMISCQLWSGKKRQVNKLNNKIMIIEAHHHALSYVLIWCYT